MERNAADTIIALIKLLIIFGGVIGMIFFVGVSHPLVSLTHLLSAVSAHFFTESFSGFSTFHSKFFPLL